MTEWAWEPLPTVKKEVNIGQQALATRKFAPSADSLPAKAAREQSGKKLALLEAARLIPGMEKEEVMAFFVDSRIKSFNIIKLNPHQTKRKPF